MVDTVTADTRSKMMAAVRGKDTAAEKGVRSALHSAGYRFRLHCKKLPGTPDIVLPRYKTAVFVHGCFWHGHGCPRGRRPVSNVTFWNAKLDGNIKRDRRTRAALKRVGWRVVVIWECSLARGCNLLVRGLNAERQRRRAVSQSAFTK